MKHIRNIALALGMTLAGGAALSGAALAEDGRDQHGWRDDDRNDGRDDDRNDNDGWRDNDRDGKDGWRDDDDDRGGWREDGRGGRHRWGHRVSVRFVNERDHWVTLFTNGTYLGRIAPNSSERIRMHAGYHTVTYRVGRRGDYQTVGVNAFRGQPNSVVIQGRRGNWRWGGW